MTASNSVGISPESNHLVDNFNPSPPLPDNAINVVVVSFLTGGIDLNNGWTINTASNPIIGGYNCNTGAFIGTNPIPFLLDLKSKGVKVLLSLGGANFFPANITNGIQLANNIAHAFFGASSGNWVPYGSTSSPAQPFIFDGLDLDFEKPGPSDLTQLTSLVTRFRTVCPNVILSMSPQPPYTFGFPDAFNANGGYYAFPSADAPTTSYNPSSPTAALLDQNYLGYFDFVFIQYFNNPDYSPPSGQYFNANLTQWARMVQSALLRTRPSTPRIIIGMASADGTPIYNITFNQVISNALNVALQNSLPGLPPPSIDYFCAGAGFWNSPTAQQSFISLYNSTNGVPNLPADVIYMWLNQSGIDPNWSILPIFDYEQPPISISSTVSHNDARSPGGGNRYFISLADFPIPSGLPVTPSAWSISIHVQFSNLDPFNTSVNMFYITATAPTLPSNDGFFPGWSSLPGDAVLLGTQGSAVFQTVVFDFTGNLNLVTTTQNYWLLATHIPSFPNSQIGNITSPTVDGDLKKSTFLSLS